MSYIHCGSKGCDWQQDDFWNLRFKPQFKFWRFRNIFGFNPVTVFLENFIWLMKPRWIGIDKWFTDDIKKKGYKLLTRERINAEKIEKYNSSQEKGTLRTLLKNEVFSWTLLYYEFFKMINKFKKMKWWTYNSYKISKDKNCPKCGKHIPSSCID